LPKMDGYEVARRLRALNTQKQPILIAVSGYGGSEEQQRCQEAGIDLHLLKPVDPEQLQSILARIDSARAAC
jgi:CheY-like chemotaxis protein